MEYLYVEQAEETIAVVCHFHVIRKILEDGENVRPQNAMPIACDLYPNGQVKQIVQEEDFNDTRKRLEYC